MNNNPQPSEIIRLRESLEYTSIGDYPIAINESNVYFDGGSVD